MPTMDVMTPATEEKLKLGGFLTISRLCAVAKKVHPTEYSCDFPGCTFKTRILNHFEGHGHSEDEKKEKKVSERKLSLRSATKLAVSGYPPGQLTDDELTGKKEELSPLPAAKALTLFRIYKKEKLELEKLKKELEMARKMANGSSPTDYQMGILAGYLSQEFLEKIRECEDETWFKRAIMLIYAQALYNCCYNKE